jgi:hypothetical protein
MPKNDRPNEKTDPAPPAAPTAAAPEPLVPPPEEPPKEPLTTDPPTEQEEPAPPPPPPTGTAALCAVERFAGLGEAIAFELNTGRVSNRGREEVQTMTFEQAQELVAMAGRAGVTPETVLPWLRRIFVDAPPKRFAGLIDQ